ncbi:hypothetical protein Taro_021107 [Colocasia esculenta]|uniref:RNase H type-1 domain-containing protein n=1 Tax=Colocasia esculenta TaxID=4460 RepID=A0A843UQF9_COLES|nr:hypothetical protein [Colocasia esculenta]
MLAEVRALCDGLRLADLLGIRLSVINSDSMALITSINTDRCPSWRAFRWWRAACSLLRREDYLVCHVYREANHVADSLANHRCMVK